jgi:DNA polymerase elongation subunit (family B)
LGWVWQKWQTDVIDFKQDWYILCFAAKWIDGKVFTHALPDFPGYLKNRENDRLLVTELWKLFDEADIIVAHNGDKFDIRKANARFTFHGLPPPTPYKTIDTKKVARKYFDFASNKLDELGRYLGYGRKLVHTGFDLWQGCMRGDKKSWNLMLRYNKRDVELLHKIYLHFRPWITNHPNTAILTDVLDGCPTCSSDSLQRRGFGITTTGKYRRYHCTECNAWSHGPTRKVTDIR